MTSNATLKLLAAMQEEREARVTATIDATVAAILIQLGMTEVTFTTAEVESVLRSHNIERLLWFDEAKDVATWRVRLTAKADPDQPELPN